MKMKYKDTFKRGARGIGKVVFSTDGEKVKATIKVKTKDTVETKEFKLLRKNCPKPLKPGIHFVSMDSDGKTMENIWPVNGMVKAKLFDFAHKEGQEPAPKTLPSQYEEPWIVFTALFKISDKDYQGSTVAVRFNYNFTSDTEDGELICVYSKNPAKSPRTQELDEMLDATGILDYAPLPYRDNMLPIFLKAAIKANKTVHLIFQNGFVNSIAPDTSEMAWDENEDDTVLEPDVETDDDWSNDETESAAGAGIDWGTEEEEKPQEQEEKISWDLDEQNW